MKQQLLLTIFLFTSFFTLYAQEHTCFHHHQEPINEKLIKESKLKAAYMYHILNQYVDWKEADKDEYDYLIGVTGDSQLVEKYLKKGATNFRKRGQQITIERLDPNKNMNEYHALFIGEVDELTYDRILLQTLGTSVITFTDIEDENQTDLADHNVKHKKNKRKRKYQKRQKALGRLNLATVKEALTAKKSILEPLIQFKIVDNKLKFAVTERTMASALLSNFVFEKSYR